MNFNRPTEQPWYDSNVGTSPEQVPLKNPAKKPETFSLQAMTLASQPMTGKIIPVTWEITPMAWSSQGMLKASEVMGWKMIPITWRSIPMTTKDRSMTKVPHPMIFVSVFAAKKASRWIAACATFAHLYTRACQASLSPKMLLAGCALFVSLLTSRTLAQPILVDFELITGMGNSPGSTIPLESRLRDQYLASHGVRFSSGSPFIAVVIHGPGTPSGTRIVGGSTPTGHLTYQSANPVVAEFFDATGTVPLIVGTVSILGDLFSISGTKTFEAFNIGGDLIATQTLLDSSPLPLTLTVPGIHRVRAYSSSATIGFDDLRFDTPVVPCPTISTQPSPAASCLGASASFTLDATGTGTPAYQWQWQPAGPSTAWAALSDGINTDSQNTPAFDVSGATTPTMDVTSIWGLGGNFRCLITDACGNVTSNEATLTILDPSDPACTSCSPCPADYNSDGGVDGSDIETFFVDWQEGATCADVNQDGGIDGTDVESFFVVWEVGGC